MKDNETNKLKGYGFIVFNDYKEYKDVLNNKEPIILGKQKLIFNSAKNKYDNTFPSYINNEYNKFGCYLNSEKENNIISNNNPNFYPDYFVINKENFNFQNYQKSRIYYGNKQPFIKRENKFELYNNIKTEKKEKNNTENDSLNEQIKNSLQNIAKNYFNNDNFIKSKICTYYCSPFIEKNILNIKKNFLYEK